MNKSSLILANGRHARPIDPLDAAVARLSARLRDCVASILPATEDGEPSPGGAAEGAVAFLDGAARTDRAFPSADLVGPTPFERLVDALGLSDLEADLLVLAGLAEEHEGYAGVFRLLDPNGQPYPTGGLAARLVAPMPPERERLRRTLETGAAASAGVIRVEGAGPFFERTLATAERLWSALRGVEAWPRGAQPRASAIVVDGLEGWLSSAPAARAARALQSGEGWTVLVTAADEEAAFARAAALAHSAGIAAARVALPPSADAGLVRAVLAHALARGEVPILRLASSDGPTSASSLPDLDGYPGPVMLATRPGSAVRGSRPVVELLCERLDLAAHRALWSRLLPDLADRAAWLSAVYPVEPDLASRAAEDARALAGLEGRPVGLDDVTLALRARTGLAQAAGVRWVRPTATWDDLILPPDRMTQLRELVGRLAHQSRVIDDWRFLAGRPGARGVRGLFAGPPGTGKSLAAEVLAHALGVDLLVVDLARTVSKWLGETEKHLAEIFAAAEHTRAALLFDEADSLFGRRTETHDAHDRHANLQTAYLLDRIERFEGLALLSTNLRQGIDAAFCRRLEFVVEFEEPGREERQALWRRHMSTSAPVADDVDPADLAACYAASGGLIRNAAVAAAFLAAAEGSSITRGHVDHAMRREFRKVGKPFPDPAPAPRTNRLPKG